MLEDFLSYIESNLSVFREDKILLSVSGGVDSMVMLHLFRQLAYKIEVAHINHSTRNGESDEDMAFVKATCSKFSIPFHSTTLDYQKLSRGNFQENARKERFAFLSNVMEKQGCKWIATAHHKDDRWETFLMHLDRKSGIKGLTSLRAKEKQVIHPLLIFTKVEILSYADNHDVSFVHDSSNDTHDYRRNAIRHQITPKIVELFPNFIENVNKAIHHLEDTSLLLDELIEQNQFINRSASSSHMVIDLKKIRSFKNQKVLLYHILDEFGFNFSTVCDILKTNQSGALFATDNYEGLYDRERLILRNKKRYVKTNLLIDGIGTYPLNSGRKIKVDIPQDSKISNDLWIDRKKVKWPLTIRNIRPGDKFKPHGMKGATKSLKKLFTDLKINRFDKEEIMIVCQENEILQVVGLRSSHNYTTTDIKNALTFSIID